MFHSVSCPYTIHDKANVKVLMQHDELLEVYIHLKDVLRQLAETPIDEELSSTDLLKDMLNIKEILESGSPLQKQSCELIRMIRRISTSIYDMISQRSTLKTKYGLDLKSWDLDNSMMNTEDTNLTKNMDIHNSSSIDIDIDDEEISTAFRDEGIHSSFCNTDSNSIKTKDGSSRNGKRLPKETIAVLNEWFNDNIENPYVQKEDISYLKAKTNLQASQIKNWVSNKRRKRKGSKVSPSIVEILN